MANPPRPGYTDPESATRAPQNRGKSWGIYIVIAIIALVVIFFLMGGFGGPDETVITTTNPSVEETPEILPADGAVIIDDTVIVPLDTVQPDTAAPADSEAPAADGTAVPVIELDGEAEVEVLDGN